MENTGDAFMNQMQIMQSIVRDMKEIPELPSEVPTDQSYLVKVEYPDEGGMLTYMSDHDYPYRGFPFFEIVEKIDIIKKISRASVSGLYHSLKKRKYWLFTLIPAVWVVRNFIEVGIYTFYRLVERFRIKPTHYSRAVKELHRAFSVPRNEDLETQELRLMLRDLVCMVLEFDNAYRFRFQDWVEDLDQVAVKKAPIKELLRVLSIAQSREKTQEIKDTWKLAKIGIGVYLRFNRKLRKLLADVLSEIDKEKFKLTPEDKHFCTRRKDYSFNWITNPKLPEDKKIMAWSKLDLALEAEKKELKDKFYDRNKFLDDKFTAELDQITPKISEEEAQARNERTQRALQELKEKFVLAEQEIINIYKTPDQVGLMNKQFQEREELKKLEDSELETLQQKYKLLKCQ